jgi:hypothetical protein
MVLHLGYVSYAFEPRCVNGMEKYQRQSQIQKDSQHKPERNGYVHRADNDDCEHESKKCQERQYTKGQKRDQGNCRDNTVNRQAVCFFCLSGIDEFPDISKAKIINEGYIKNGNNKWRKKSQIDPRGCASALCVDHRKNNQKNNNRAAK